MKKGWSRWLHPFFYCSVANQPAVMMPQAMRVPEFPDG
jgi:hypothetical protein